ncbi:hypothetical protein JCM11491_004417 [Sporobolomyces phaffii]
MLARTPTATSATASTVSNKSMLKRFFSRRRHSEASSDQAHLVPKAKADGEIDLFAEIMALNARHGDPSVQAYSVKPRPAAKNKTAKPPKVKAAPAAGPPPPPPYDAFDAIMRLNARHCHPSVQAHFVR